MRGSHLFPCPRDEAPPTGQLCSRGASLFLSVITGSHPLDGLFIFLYDKDMYTNERGYREWIVFFVK